jgi:hypothetical protein
LLLFLIHIILNNQSSKNSEISMTIPNTQG